MNDGAKFDYSLFENIGSIPHKIGEREKRKKKIQAVRINFVLLLYKSLMDGEEKKLAKIG